MKIRTLFITFLAPCFLFLFFAQLANNILTDKEQCDKDILSLQLTVMLKPGATDDIVSNISSEIHKISGYDVKKITAGEELARFQSKFGVNVMEVLSDNPFGPVLQTSVGPDDNPSNVRATVNKIRGVRFAAYPEKKRNEIQNAYINSCNRNYLLAFIFSISIILIVWMSEFFEVSVNSQLIKDKKASRVPVSRIKSAFNSHSFVKGAVIGLTSSILFILIRFGLDTDFETHIDRYLIISAVIIITSTLLVLIMHGIAMSSEIKKRH